MRKEDIEAIIRESTDAVDTAIKLCLYCMNAQIFNDGNKRAAVIFTNHYMITQGQALRACAGVQTPAGSLLRKLGHWRNHSVYG